MRERDALKASRRNFGAFFGLSAHEEADNEDRDDSFMSDEEQRRRDVAGLAASWKPTAPFRQTKGLRDDVIQESLEESELAESRDSDQTTRPARSELLFREESTKAGDGHYFFNPEDSQLDHDQPPEDLQFEIPLHDDDEEDDNNSETSENSPPLLNAPPAPIYQSQDPDQSFHSYPPRQPLSDDALPRPVSAPPLAAVSHDSTWAAFYGLSMAGMFATSFMIWIGTESPENGLPLGDTIYSALHSAFPLLMADGILAIGIALLWLILMRHALQPFIYLLLFTVPISMFTLFLVPLIQSFRGSSGGSTFQDKAMRWASFIPALIGIWWTYKMWKERHSLHRAVSIIALSGKIVKENSALVGFSFSVLGGFIAFTFIWVLMFTRVFLRSYTTVEGGIDLFCLLADLGIMGTWVIPTSSWWLGAYYIFMFLWTWGVFSGIQRYLKLMLCVDDRATTAATVSQWYFHRHSMPPNTPSKTVVLAAVSHTFSTLLGTVCLSSFIALVCRVPLLAFPRRITWWFQWFFFLIIPGPLINLVLPLTLTHAAIRSVPLVVAARNNSRLRVLDTSRGHPFASYRMAKMILSATRLATALSMGIGGWIWGARQEILDGSITGAAGSLYGYLVGLIAGAVGWVVVGGIEGAAGMVVDACFVCFAVDFEGGIEGMGHCREAWQAFGGRV